MKVSDILLKVRYELAEPTPSEWKNDELVSYMNDGFASAWRLAAELHHHMVETEDDITIPAGERSVHLSSAPVNLSPPLKLIEAFVGGRPLPYVHPSQMPRDERAGVDMWTVAGLDELRVWGTPEEETVLTLRWVREPELLRYEPTTLTDSDVPLPSSILELLVNFVIAKAQNRLGGKPAMEMQLFQQYRRDVMRALEIREPTLVTCSGYWISGLR